MSTRILSRRTAPVSPFLITHPAPRMGYLLPGHETALAGATELRSETSPPGRTVGSGTASIPRRTPHMPHKAADFGHEESVPVISIVPQWWWAVSSVLPPSVACGEAPVAATDLVHGTDECFISGPTPTLSEWACFETNRMR